MRRQKVVSIKVKAPSRGLVTRWPSEAADMLRGGSQALSQLLGAASVTDQQRVCFVAQNVRFENGVIAAAPGYETVIFLDIAGNAIGSEDGGNNLIGSEDGGGLSA